jgi:ribosomal protein S18 acetylase RimI-like enzyme
LAYAGTGSKTYIVHRYLEKISLAELEKRAKAMDCRQTILVTETERKAACRFYESAGFHPTANKGYKKKL